jgi:leader peptidase (prepilin peptidase)/N-methyltransferase
MGGFGGTPDFRQHSPRGYSDVWIWCAALGCASFTSFHALAQVDALFAIPFAALALYLAKTDLDRFELPDPGNLALFALGLGWIAASSLDVGEGLVQALIRALSAAAFLVAIRTIYRGIRKMDGLGWGDVKLAAAGAVWLSWSQMPIALLIGALAGILVATVHAAYSRRTLTLQVALPFGALLAPAIWLVWFAGLSGLL